MPKNPRATRKASVSPATPRRHTVTPKPKPPPPPKPTAGRLVQVPADMLVQLAHYLYVHGDDGLREEVEGLLQGEDWSGEAQRTVALDRVRALVADGSDAPVLREDMDDRDAVPVLTVTVDEVRAALAVPEVPHA